MTQHGYRLFVVELHHGMRPAVQPICDATQELSKKKDDVLTGIDYRDVVIDEVTAKIGSTLKFGVSDEKPADTVAKSAGSSMRFKSVKLDGENVRFEFVHGAIHIDGTVIDPDDATPDQHLRGKATIYSYRASLIARPGNDRGILAVEVRGRSCPVVPVIRGLKMVSAAPWRLRPSASLADQAAMENFIRRGEVIGARFQKWSHMTDGQPSRREVQMSLSTITEGEKLKKRAIRWMQKYFGFEPILDEFSDEKPDSKSQAEAAKDDIFVNEVVDIDFNDVSVEIENNGVRKIISPASDFSKFTYVLGDDDISDTTFFSQAEQTAELMLARVQKIEIPAESAPE